GARRVGEGGVGRDLDVPLARLLGDELPRDDLFDRARRALHLDAMVLLQKRHDVLALEVEKLCDFVNPNCCQKLPLVLPPEGGSHDDRVIRSLLPPPAPQPPRARPPAPLIRPLPGRPPPDPPSR